jgi:hypothetical protein
VNWRLWAARAVLIVGVAGSIWGNILHAQPGYVAVIWAGLAPFALFIAVELIAWMPRRDDWIGKTRLAMAVVIGVIAAWVSYWHQVAVVRRVGETLAGAEWLLPLVWDMLIGIGTLSMVALARPGVLAPQSSQHSEHVDPTPAPPTITEPVQETPLVPVAAEPPPKPNSESVRVPPVDSPLASLSKEERVRHAWHHGPDLRTPGEIMAWLAAADAPVGKSTVYKEVAALKASTNGHG